MVVRVLAMLAAGSTVFNQAAKVMCTPLWLDYDYDGTSTDKIDCVMINMKYVLSRTNQITNGNINNYWLILYNINHQLWQNITIVRKLKNR